MPKTNSQKFLEIKTNEELASFFYVSTVKKFTYFVYKKNMYKQFKIRKKYYGNRIINAPNEPIKRFQRILNCVLQDIYDEQCAKENKCSFGFLRNKGIINNAKLHTKKKYVLNFDLKDFFPSIHYGRIRGLFLKYFRFTNDVANTLARLCSNNGVLPQGAPTSPIISNFIAYKLDLQLKKIAFENDCIYTRYADDITFSSHKPFNSNIFDNTYKKVSTYIYTIVKNNNFEINENKTRMSAYTQKQVVTGLIVNSFVNVDRKYVRTIRAILNNWLKKSKDEALSKYKELTGKNVKDLGKIMVGKLSHIANVKGYNDTVYRNYARRLSSLYPKFEFNNWDDGKSPIIITEGISDANHLIAALNSLRKLGKYINMQVCISKTDVARGDNILNECEYRSRNINYRKYIYMIDRDKIDVVNKMNGSKGYKVWGNNAYSFAIPKVNGRYDNISIEFYYSNNEITRIDENGRRLYLSTEFDNTTGCLLSDTNVICKNKKYKASVPTIIDNQVIRGTDSIALSKNKFSENILYGVENFDDFNFNNFDKIFEIINTIINIP